jgi:hypothetical protein
MEETPRHQCLIYDGSPAKILTVLASEIKRMLDKRWRCLYLNSSAWVTAMQSHLLRAGVDVPSAIESTSLILTSDQNQLRGNRFDGDALLQVLTDSLNQTTRDGYEGFWASGDISWELGEDQDLQKLLEYEWKLEEYFTTHKNLIIICQYHLDVLPRDVVYHSLYTHPAVFIHPTLSHVNPIYLSTNAPLDPLPVSSEMKNFVQNLCALQPPAEVDE